MAEAVEGGKRGEGGDFLDVQRSRSGFRIGWPSRQEEGVDKGEAGEERRFSGWPSRSSSGDACA